MSIQIWHSDCDGEMCCADGPSGTFDWVDYEDHVAELEQVKAERDTLKATIAALIAQPTPEQLELFRSSWFANHHEWQGNVLRIITYWQEIASRAAEDERIEAEAESAAGQQVLEAKN